MKCHALQYGNMNILEQRVSPQTTMPVKISFLEEYFQQEDANNTLCGNYQITELHVHFVPILKKKLVHRIYRKKC